MEKQYDVVLTDSDLQALRSLRDYAPSVVESVERQIPTELHDGLWARKMENTNTYDLYLVVNGRYSDGVDVFGDLQYSRPVDDNNSAHWVFIGTVV